PEGLGGTRQMVEQAVAADDFGSKVVGGLPALDVEQPDLERRKTAAEYCDIGGPSVGRDHTAFAVQEKARQVADPGTDLEHGSAFDWKPERCQMLQAPLGQSKIAIRMEFSFGRDAKSGHLAHHSVQCPLAALEYGDRRRARLRYSVVSHD